MGLVWLDGYHFGNGTIEIDLLGRSQPIKGAFSASRFAQWMHRRTMRCTSGHSTFGRCTRSAHSHAVQYVSDPRWTWQILRSEHPGEYEKAVVPEPDGDEWFHARIVVERPKVSVFVNSASAPWLWLLTN